MLPSPLVPIEITVLQYGALLDAHPEWRARALGPQHIEHVDAQGRRRALRVENRVRGTVHCWRYEVRDDTTIDADPAAGPETYDRPGRPKRKG